MNFVPGCSIRQWNKVIEEPSSDILNRIGLSEISYKLTLPVSTAHHFSLFTSHNIKYLTLIMLRQVTACAAKLPQSIRPAPIAKRLINSSTDCPDDKKDQSDPHTDHSRVESDLVRILRSDLDNLKKTVNKTRKKMESNVGTLSTENSNVLGRLETIEKHIALIHRLEGLEKDVTLINKRLDSMEKNMALLDETLGKIGMMLTSEPTKDRFGFASDSS